MAGSRYSHHKNKLLELFKLLFIAGPRLLRDLLRVLFLFLTPSKLSKVSPAVSCSTPVYKACSSHVAKSLAEYTNSSRLSGQLSCQQLLPALLHAISCKIVRFPCPVTYSPSEAACRRVAFSRYYCTSHELVHVLAWGKQLGKPACFL